jgi:hypothetical protein
VVNKGNSMIIIKRIFSLISKKKTHKAELKIKINEIIVFDRFEIKLESKKNTYYESTKPND